MKRWILLFLILILAAGLRFYKAGSIPHGLSFDEAAIAYNAWSIAVWHRDEFANFMPLSFKSFGDYKPPLLIYLMSVPYLLFGLHPEWLRWFSALVGLGTVLVTYLIGKEVMHQHAFTKNSKVTIPLDLASALFVAISPWAIHFSRLGYEQNLTVFLLTLGMWCLLMAERQIFYWRYAAIILALALYSFHTAKVFLLFFGLWFIIWSFKRIKNNWKEALLSGAIFGILVSPMVYDSIKGMGGERANTLIFLDQSGKWEPLINIGESLGTNILAYLNPRFWVMGYDAIGLRHGVPGVGVMYYLTFGLFLLGLIVIFKKRLGFRWFVGWIIAGFLPSIVSETTPHALRSLLAVVPLEIAAAIGLWWLSAKVPRLVTGIVLLLIGTQLSFYLYSYYGQYRISSAREFQYGLPEALSYIKSTPSVETVVVSDAFEQPYIYVLLYNRIRAESFLFGALSSYQFRKISWPESKAKTIFIATPDDISPKDPRVIETIMVPDSDIPAVVIAKT